MRIRQAFNIPETLRYYRHLHQHILGLHIFRYNSKYNSKTRFKCNILNVPYDNIVIITISSSIFTRYLSSMLKKKNKQTATLILLWIDKDQERENVHLLHAVWML